MAGPGLGVLNGVGASPASNFYVLYRFDLSDFWRFQPSLCFPDTSGRFFLSRIQIPLPVKPEDLTGSVEELGERIQANYCGLILPCTGG